MPALMHFVVSITNCIGVGRHAIPISSVSHCVFVTLHNVLLSSFTTNADHEPARRYLIRMFIFIALAFTDPHNTYAMDDDQSASQMKGKGKAKPKGTDTYEQYRRRQPLTARMRAHLPDLTTADGLLDLIALRSFVVLFIALGNKAYDFQVTNGSLEEALPLDSQICREIEYAWTLVTALDDYIGQNYDFMIKHGCSGVESYMDVSDVSYSYTPIKFKSAIIAQCIPVSTCDNGCLDVQISRGVVADHYKDSSSGIHAVCIQTTHP